MNANSIPDDLEELWSRFQAAEKVPEQKSAMAEIIKKLVCDLSEEKAALDIVLVECTVQPQLFELGMCVAMLATEYVREAFRRRLVESGAVFQAVRLARQMHFPLSREEIVMLGNRHLGGLVREEVERFLSDAAKTEGMTELDLRRLRKQLEARAI